MKCLSFDTSTRVCAISVFNLEKPFDAFTLKIANQLDHSERLLAGVDNILKSNQLTLDNIEAIGIGVGPGSFTGIRIGIATARMLSKVLDIKLIPFSSMSFLLLSLLEAYGIQPQEEETIQLLVEGFGGELFGKRGSYTKLIESIGDVKMGGRGAFEDCLPLETWSQFSTDKVIGARTAFPIDLNSILPSVLAEVTHRSYEASGLKNTDEVLPNYFKASSAEIKVASRTSR